MAWASISAWSTFSKLPAEARVEHAEGVDRDCHFVAISAETEDRIRRIRDHVHRAAQLEVPGEQIRVLGGLEHRLDALLGHRPLDERGERGAGELEGLHALHDHAAVAVEGEAGHARRDHLRHREAAGLLDDQDRLVGTGGMLDSAAGPSVAARGARRRGAAAGIGLGSSRRATGGGARREDDGEHDEEARGGSFHGGMDAAIRGSVPERFRRQ